MKIKVNNKQNLNYVARNMFLYSYSALKLMVPAAAPAVPVATTATVAAITAGTVATTTAAKTAAIATIAAGTIACSSGSPTQTVKPPVTTPPPIDQPPIITPKPTPPKEVTDRPPFDRPVENPDGRKPGVLLKAFDDLLKDPDFRAKLERLGPVNSMYDPMTPEQKEVSDMIYETYNKYYTLDTCTVNSPFAQEDREYLSSKREIQLSFNNRPEIGGSNAVFPGRVSLRYIREVHRVPASSIFALTDHENRHLDGQGEQEVNYSETNCAYNDDMVDHARWNRPNFKVAILESGKVNERKYNYHAAGSNQELKDYLKDPFHEIDFDKLEYVRAVEECCRESGFCNLSSDAMERVRKNFLAFAEEQGMHEEFDRLKIGTPPVLYGIDEFAKEAARYFARISLATSDVMRFNENKKHTTAEALQHPNNVKASQQSIDLVYQFAIKQGLRPSPTVLDDFAKYTQDLLRQMRIEKWYAQQDLANVQSNIQSVSLTTPKLASFTAEVPGNAPSLRKYVPQTPVSERLATLRRIGRMSCIFYFPSGILQPIYFFET